jgi:hypothetical protein
MLRSLWRSLPGTTRAGLAFAGYGVLADLIHHVFAPGLHAGKVMHIGFIGHVLTLAGMVLALWGVIRAAVDSHRRIREKGGKNAARSSAAVAR